MRPIAVSLLLVLAGLCVLAATVGPATTPREFPVHASASAALWLGVDKATVGRNESLEYTIWVNVSGSGQVQSASLNLTFPSYPNQTAPAILLIPGAATVPPGCFRLADDAWQCFSLRGGNAYRWSIPANVSEDASLGYVQAGNATLVAQTGSASETLTAAAGVYIAGARMEVRISSEPAFAARAGEAVRFWINATNTADVEANQTANSTANDVILTVALDPWLRLGPGSPPLTKTAANLTPGSTLAYEIQVIVQDNTTPGTLVGIRASLAYEDFNGYPLRLENRSAPIYIRVGDVVSGPNLIAGAAIGLVAIVATLVVLLYLGQRRLTIEEAFLMHRSGVLLHHVSRNPDLRKDDDLVASMFVAIQEFVRDSFQSEALLDEVSFGGRRAAVVRGEHTVLAAVITRGDVAHLVPQMLAALRAVESTYGHVLDAWDGHMARLAGVDRILNRFLAGGFRSAWRARLT